MTACLVPCPKCGEKYEAQSKGGECSLSQYELAACPQDVLSDVNRHAPFVCEKCGCMFDVTEAPRVIPGGSASLIPCPIPLASPKLGEE